jgi:DNA-binding PadR family transcriptional regulator
LTKINGTLFPSQKEAKILQLIKNGAKSGIKIIEKSGGSLKLRHIYTYLSRMNKKKFIEVEKLERNGKKGHPRKNYQLTTNGKTALNMWIAANSISTPTKK